MAKLFEENHVAKKCPSKFSCYKCRSKHNTCLCELINDSSMTTAHSVLEEQTLPAMVNLSPGDEPVLLKTAMVSVSKMTDDEYCIGRLLFDDASSRSYITKKLYEKLKLEPISKRQVLIKGACATSTLTDCNVVQLKVKTFDPLYIVVIASVLEEICHPIEGQLIKLAKKNYPH